MGSVLEDEGIRGELVRIARTDAGLTQVELAEMAGISFQAMSNIERGAQPKPAVLRRIARATGRTTDWFYGDSAAPPPAPLPAKSQEPPGPDLASAIAQAVAQAMAPLVQAQVRSETRLGRIEGLLYHQRDILERQGETQEAILDELRQENQEGCCGHDDQRGAA